MLEALESRCLLAGAYELFTALPAGTSTNLSFADSAQAGGKLLFTSVRDGGNEQLWGTGGAGAPAELLLASSQDGFRDGNGVTGLTTFNGKTYFFANTNAGDGLF